VDGERSSRDGRAGALCLASEAGGATVTTKGQKRMESKGDTEATQTTAPVRSIERALEIVRILRENRAPMRLTDIARESGNHLATAQRMVNVLVRHGYVVQERNNYSIGITSLLNAHAFLVSNSLIQVAHPVVQELASFSGLASSFAVRVGLKQIQLLRVYGVVPLPYQLPIGEPMPLHLGGARILAAALSPEDLQLLLDETPEIRLANGTVVTQDEFIKSLQVIREQGYVCGYSQRELGAGSAAVPVYGPDETVVAALQLSWIVDEVDDAKMEWCVTELKRASAAITRRIP